MYDATITNASHGVTNVVFVFANLDLTCIASYETKV
jgi:hypothetical protein